MVGSPAIHTLTWECPQPFVSVAFNSSIVALNVTPTKGVGHSNANPFVCLHSLLKCTFVEKLPGADSNDVMQTSLLLHYENDSQTSRGNEGIAFRGSCPKNLSEAEFTAFLDLRSFPFTRNVFSPMLCVAALANILFSSVV